MLRFLQNVLSRLEREGVDCAVACPSFMHSSLPSLHTLPWEIPDRPRLTADIRWAWQARRWQQDYDLLHAHGLRAVSVLSILPPARWLFMLHNLPPENLSLTARWLLRRAARSTKNVLSVSRAVQSAWLKHFPDTEPKCTVVPGGVDVHMMAQSVPDAPEARSRWNLPVHAPVALCVGRLMEDKGVDVLLNALVHAPQWFALIVGEGPLRHSLQKLAADLGVGERVRFTGYLESLDCAWATCDVAVVPSRREGLGLFALEAMAACKPVIASSTGGLVEIVRHGENGWLVPPEDPLALANMLQQAFAFRDAWREIGEQGRRYVRQHYTWEHTVQRLLECYQRLVST